MAGTADLYRDLPKTDAMFKRCFMIPMHVALSDEDVEYVCDAIRAFYKKG